MVWRFYISKKKKVLFSCNYAQVRPPGPDRCPVYRDRPLSGPPRTPVPGGLWFTLLPKPRSQVVSDPGDRRPGPGTGDRPVTGFWYFTFGILHWNMKGISYFKTHAFRDQFALGVGGGRLPWNLSKILMVSYVRLWKEHRWWFFYGRIKEGESQGKNVTLELWYTVSR